MTHREDRSALRIPAIRAARQGSEVPGFRGEVRLIEGATREARTDESTTSKRTAE